MGLAECTAVEIGRQLIVAGYIVLFVRPLLRPTALFLIKSGALIGPGLRFQPPGFATTASRADKPAGPARRSKASAATITLTR